MATEPLCDSCEYRRTIPGNTHSRCVHPAVPNNPLADVLSLIDQRGGPIPCDGVHVTGHPHGIRMGWFAWPFTFDPMWLKSCDGYRKKARE